MVIAMENVPYWSPVTGLDKLQCYEMSDQRMQKVHNAILSMLFIMQMHPKELVFTSEISIHYSLLNLRGWHS